MALLLNRKGITKVRPLLGGLDEWQQLGFPLTIHAIATKNTKTLIVKNN